MVINRNNNNKLKSNNNNEAILKEIRRFQVHLNVKGFTRNENVCVTQEKINIIDMYSK